MDSSENSAMEKPISTPQSRTSMILHWLEEVEENPFPSQLTSAARRDLPPDVSAAYEIAANGVWCFAKSMYATSYSFFNVALEILIARYGKFAKECSFLYYKCALCLMYEHPVPRDGLITGVPLEKDYQPRMDHGGVIRGARGDGNFVAQCEEPCDVSQDNGEKRELAWEILEIACSIDDDGADSLAKADILSAMAELRYMKFDTVAAISYYKGALAMMDQLIAPTSLRLVHIMYKLSICLEETQLLSEATDYCLQGLDTCLVQLQDLWHRLKNQFKSRESTTGCVREDETVKEEFLDVDLPLPRISILDHYSLPLLEIEIERVQELIRMLHVQSTKFHN